MTTLGLLTLVLMMLASLLVGALGVFALTRLGGRGWRGRRAGLEDDRIQIQIVAERVRTVGKIVGLEVSAKEIATATKGWAWLPPLLLSQARLAMIFHFEKQYFVDLRRITHADITELGDGRYRIVLPPIEGTLRLTDVTPYDIQDGRVLGLLDVIQMTADTQKDLMRRAQRQAAELYHVNDARYLIEARQSTERHLRALLELLGVRVEISWADHPANTVPAQRHDQPLMASSMAIPA
jgi:hypothetical protein